MILIFDCETTGLPDFKSPSDAPHQPHIVQFAAILIDPVTRIERASVDLIVKPDGWTIPDEVAAIHGITNEIALACGVHELDVASIFFDLRRNASVEVAHNISFDRRIMKIAGLRTGMTREDVEETEKGKTFCTMKEATAIVNLPPTAKMLASGFTKPKPPKLSECMKHFFNEELDGAHNALVDVRACTRLYFHLQDLKVPA